MVRLALLLFAAALLPAHAADPNKVFRYAFEIAETNTHRIRTDMWYPHVIGYHRTLVASTNWWKYIDIDNSKRPGKVARK